MFKLHKSTQNGGSGGRRHLGTIGCTQVNKTPIQPTLNDKYSKIYEKYLEVSQSFETKTQNCSDILALVFFSILWGLSRVPPSYARQKEKHRDRR